MSRILNQTIEILFFGDILSFEEEGVQEDRDLLGKGILENYLSPTNQLQPKISKESSDHLKAVLKQTPLATDLFQGARLELIKLFLHESFPNLIQNASMATMYRRKEGKHIKFPIEVLEAFKDEILGGKNWKEIKRKEVSGLYSKQYPGYSGAANKHLISLDQPPDVVAQLLLKPNKTKGFTTSSQHIVETLNNETFIFHHKFRNTFTSNHELIYLRTSHTLSDGTIVLVSHSIDYPSIPITRKYERNVLVFAGYVFQKTAKGTDLWTVSFFEGKAPLSLGKWIKQSLQNLNTQNVEVKKYLQPKVAK